MPKHTSVKSPVVSRRVETYATIPPLPQTAIPMTVESFSKFPSSFSVVGTNAYFFYVPIYVVELQSYILAYDSTYRCWPSVAKLQSCFWLATYIGGPVRT
jgi:hypothetical protein